MDEDFGPRVPLTSRRGGFRDESAVFPGEGYLAFEDQAVSPYLESVAGPYDLPPRVELDGSRVDGRCPLCNNSRRGELDALIMRSSTLAAAARGCGFPSAVVARHAAYHLGPMAGKLSGVAIEGLPEADEEADIRALVIVEKAAKALQAPDPRADRALQGVEAREYPSDSRYAYDGSVRVGPPRPWTMRRAAVELAKLRMETINFYDEMMEVRGCTKEIYDRIMNPPDGSEPDPKLYGTAVQAVRERGRVVQTLATMALIAKKLGEDDEGQSRRRSPELQSVMDALGVRNALAAPGVTDVIPEPVGAPDQEAVFDED